MSSPAHSQGLNELDDNRVTNLRPLIPPQILMEDLPLSEEASKTVSASRREAEAIIRHTSDKFLVIVGPCSIHDVKAAKEYAALLKAYAESQDELCIVMRVYFEKPRTTVGWKGLINDPFLNGTFEVNRGLRMARSLLLDLNNMGVGCAVEFLDTISPQFVADLVSWGAIGARTTESQVHRELASGLSTPVGFKNGTDGGIAIAVDAIRAASAPHCFLGVTKQGLSAIVQTSGNEFCHIILRGGTSGPNYDAMHVQKCAEAMTKANVTPSIMIDCSHGNSLKQHERQILVAREVAQQLKNGNDSVIGVMIESHLVAGRQDLKQGQGLEALVYGQSITDACINWDDTVKVLDLLREAVRDRREFKAAQAKN
jgi:3-deoxy-7-phosphoheptulonate synthase